MEDFRSDVAFSGSDHDSTIDLIETAKAIWRGKIWVILFSVIFAALGTYYAFFVAIPKYQSTVVLQLDLSGESIVDLGVGLPSLGGSSEELNTEVEVIKSRRMAERVVLAENLVDDPEFNGFLRPKSLKTRLSEWIKAPGEPPTDSLILAKVVRNFQQAVSVRNIPDTYVLQISVLTEDREKPARLADRIATEYIQYTIDVGVEETLNASTWLSERAADLKVNLENAEAQVSAFSSQAEILSENNLRALEVNLKSLRDREADAVDDLAALEERLST